MTLVAVFDCDGTLADGQHAIVAAMTRALRDCGGPVAAPAAIRRITGLSVEDAVRVLWTGADGAAVSAAAGAYRDAYRAAREAAGALPEPLYDGIPELLDRLAASGWTLAVATGKSDRGMRRLLAAHGLVHRFAAVETADRHPGKPDPAMLCAALAGAGGDVASAVMIGDTSYDMAMARAAGVTGIGVAWGYHDPDELMTAGAAVVVDDVEALEDWMRCWAMDRAGVAR